MKIFSITLFLIVALSPSLCSADVLLIKRIEQEQSIDMPKRGLSMEQVINQYGEPSSKNNPIGRPPITEWHYEKFSVYFEKKWVISSVAYKASANEKGPKYIK